MTTKQFRVSDLANKAITKLAKHLLGLEEFMLKSSERKGLQNLKNEKIIRPHSSNLERLSISEQNYIKLGDRVPIKNAVHVEEDKPSFIANYVYHKPTPQYIQDRVLSADKRQEIITGESSNNRPLSKFALVEAKVKEINVEQNKRNKLMDIRSQKEHVEEIKKAMIHAKAEYWEGPPENSKRPPSYLPRADTMERLPSEKSIQHEILDIPQPIEEVVREYKKMKSIMTPSNLMGYIPKNSLPLTEDKATSQNPNTRELKLHSKLK